MRIIIFLLISSLLHLAVILGTNINTKVSQNHFSGESFSVIIANENISKNPDTFEKVKKLIKPKKNLILNRKDNESEQKTYIVNPALQNTQDTDIPSIVTKYYSNTEVQRKALQQTNIDETMLLAQEGVSGLPIKMRLYINASGAVVNVEPIAVLDQDIIFVENLTKLLYEITFLPAKRDGKDVDSYQDLLLSFNPLPIAEKN